MVDGSQLAAEDEQSSTMRKAWQRQKSIMSSSGVATALFIDCRHRDASIELVTSSQRQKKGGFRAMKLHDPVMTYPVTCDASSAGEEASVRPGCHRRSNRDAKSMTDKGECS
jgi:hypothetical protein